MSHLRTYLHILIELNMVLLLVALLLVLRL